MTWLQLIVLSLVQGITEFLPVSSSAHLILVPKLTNWQDQGLLFDIAVHFGTLMAVIVYYRRDLWQMSHAFIADTTRHRLDYAKFRSESKLALAVILATLPLVVIGFLAKDFIEQNMRNPLIIAAATIFFGIVLGLSAYFGKKRNLNSLQGSDILIIGLAQVLALIPGTSRSGITISAALFRGFKPQEAARFSFLLSIPAILLPFAWYMLKLIKSDIAHSIIWLDLLLICSLSFVSALLAIDIFIKLLAKVGMLPFVAYRLILGAFLLWYFV